MVNSRAKIKTKTAWSGRFSNNTSPFEIGGSVIATIVNMYWYTSRTERLSELVSIVTDLDYLIEFIKSTPQYKKQLNETKKPLVKKVLKNGKLKSKRGSRRARASKQVKGVRLSG